MKCKKILLVSSIFAAMALSNVANAADGLNGSYTINFTGNFLDKTCTINVNGSAEGAEVDLQNVAIADLKVAGNASVAKEFKVGFTDCSTLKNAAISFTGDNIDDKGYFSVEGDNKDAVAVAINEVADAVSYIANGAKVDVALSNEGTNEHLFYARFIKTSADPVKPGPAKATANMNVVYQ